MASYIRRRKFLATLGGAVAAWSLQARAQQPKVPVIGFVTSVSARDSRQTVAAFHRGLNEAAFIEGQNVAIEYRWRPGLLAHQIRQIGPHALGIAFDVRARGAPSMTNALYYGDTRTARCVCACVGSAIFLLATLGAAAAETKRVLMLHSFDRDVKPWSAYAKNIRAELEQQSRWPLEICDPPPGCGHLLAALRAEAPS